MKANTRYFGEVEYGPEDELAFVRGMFGFEDETKFLLLPFEADSVLYSLQSLATPQLSFLLMHPFSLDGSYAPVLQPEELKALHAERSEDLCYYVLCALRKPVAESTINMKCPIAVNLDTMEAMQVILEDGPWQMRHPLSEFEAGKEASPC